MSNATIRHRRRYRAEKPRRQKRRAIAFYIDAQMRVLREIEQAERRVADSYVIHYPIGARLRIDAPARHLWTRHP